MNQVLLINKESEYRIDSIQQLEHILGKYQL